jgi:quercetin dioxygenase-like cupin family protein
MNTPSRRRILALGLGVLGATLRHRAISNTNGTADINHVPNIDDLLEQTHAFLISLNAPDLNPFLADWPRTRERRANPPASLPVLNWLPQIKANAPGYSATLIAELLRLTPVLSWHQTYKQPAVGAAFLDNYGYTELTGLTGPVPSQRLACGFLLLGPSTTYPRHRHEAEEIYVPLSGTAAWQHGNQGWRDESPGTVIHHASNEPHAMRTGKQPLLALYLWRSDNLDQKSRLDPAAGT